MSKWSGSLISVQADVSIRDLERLACAFDEIGDELGGARYPAAAFVRFVADELAARADDRNTREMMQAGAMRRRLTGATSGDG